MALTKVPDEMLTDAFVSQVQGFTGLYGPDSAWMADKGSLASKDVIETSGRRIGQGVYRSSAELGNAAPEMLDVVPGQEPRALELQWDVEGYESQTTWALSTAYVVGDLVEKSATEGVSKWYCILDHTSSATDEPGVGVNAATYWLQAASSTRGLHIAMKSNAKNSRSIAQNIAIYNGGMGGADATHWGIIIEGWDSSTSSGSAGGVPDIGDHPTIDAIGSDQSFIGMEINHKMKSASTAGSGNVSVGMQIIPRSYGETVAVDARPTFQRSYSSRSGRSGTFGGVNTVAAHVDVHYAAWARPTDYVTASNTAESNWGMALAGPFQNGAIGLTYSDKIVLDAYTPSGAGGVAGNENLVIQSTISTIDFSVDGGTTNTLTVGTNRVTVNAAAGTRRSFSIRSAGVERWHLRANNAAESGSDLGSDFELSAYDDAGTTETIALKAFRNTGDVMALNRLHVGTTAYDVLASTEATGATTTANGTLTVVINGTTYYLLTAAAS